MADGDVRPDRLKEARVLELLGNARCQPFVQVVSPTNDVSDGKPVKELLVGGMV